MYTYKKTLTNLFLLLLYTLTNPLQATNISYADNDDQKEGFIAPTQPLSAAQKQITVYDYTILNNKNVNHTLDDIEEIDEDLGDNLLAINAKLVTTNNQPSPLLLGAVLQHQQNHDHHQYLIANTGLLPEATQSNAVTKAHKKGFHLIQATCGHVILQLLEWLQVSKNYTVIALSTNKPVCQHCYLIASNLWKQKLKTNKKGCVSMPFPLLDKIPNLAKQYINTHLNLSLVQSFVIPMMGYVSEEEMQKIIQKSKEMASSFASKQEMNNKQITILSKKVKKKETQLNKKNEQITRLQVQIKKQNEQLEENDEKIDVLNKEINKKDKQLNDKSQELNNLKAQLRKCIEQNTDYQYITEKLNKLRNEFKMQINNIDIQNENAVKSFVEKIRENFKELNEDIKILRKWHAKYQGNDWKDFCVKNSDDISWGKIYNDIEKK